jgi:hypothetical protein
MEWLPSHITVAMGVGAMVANPIAWLLLSWARPDIVEDLRRDAAAAQPATAAKPEMAPALHGASSVVVFRLRPDQDLGVELRAYVQRHKLRACTVVSCVGSLKGATLRLANSDRYGNEVRHTHTRLYTSQQSMRP